jgi:hypothetical protein
MYVAESFKHQNYHKCDTEMEILMRKKEEECSIFKAEHSSTPLLSLYGPDSIIHLSH